MADRVLQTWTLTPSNDNGDTRQCKVDLIVYDNNSMTPTSAKYGFRAYNFTSNFTMPLHVLIDNKYYLRLAEGLESGTRDTSYSLEVTQYTEGTMHWWKDATNNTDPVKNDLQFTKGAFDIAWDVSRITFSTHYDAKTADAFTAWRDCAVIYGTDAYSDIANAFGNPSFTAIQNNHTETWTITEYTHLEYYLSNIRKSTDPEKYFFFDNVANATTIINLINRYSYSANVHASGDHLSRNPFGYADQFFDDPLENQGEKLDASYAVAAGLIGNASISITDNGNNTYSFTVNTTVSAGAVGNKKNYHPLKSEKITYQIWEKGKSSTQTLYLPEINHTLSLQPTGENRTLGPYGPYKWQPKNTNDTNKATVIYEAKGIYDTAVSKRYSSNLAIKNYIAPSSPNVEDAFYYFTNSSVPRPYSKLSFVWQTATASNTVSPIKGYRIAIYTKQKSKGETSFSRLANLGCSLVMRSATNTASLEIYYCGPEDPLRTSSQALLPDIRDDADGFIYSDNFFAEDVNAYNIPIPTEASGKRLNASGKAEPINFLGDFYNKDKTWRGVTIDLDSFPEEKRLDTGDELYIRVTAYSRNKSGNGAGDLLKSTWDSTQSPITEGAPVPAVGGASKAADPIEIMKATAVMRPKVSGSWKEGNVWVKVDGTWKEAEAVYVKQDGAWKESQ